VRFPLPDAHLYSTSGSSDTTTENLERNGVHLLNRRLEQARRLLALAQTGLHYSTGPFDIERYREIAKIAHAQLGEIADLSTQEVAELFSKEEGYANPKEESGYIVHISRLLAVWDMQRHSHPPSLFHIWKLVFLGEIVDVGEFVGGETDDVGFFDLDALPTLSLGRVLPEQLHRLDELRRRSEVEFD
jgi:Hydrolase of X-linked nucleoside diphosphate N terminal